MPTLLVFGSYPRLSESDPPSPSITQRAAAIKKATQELLKLRANRQVTDALRQRNGPRVDNIHDLEAGSEVLVWRIHKKAWTGPYKLLTIEGETATVEINGRPIQFRTTVIKPYLQEPPASEPAIQPDEPTAGTLPPEGSIQPAIQPAAQPDIQPDNTLPEDTIVVEDPGQPKPLQRPRGRPRKQPRSPDNSFTADITIRIPDPYPQNTWLSGKPFEQSRQKELNGLFEHGVFEIVDHIPPNSQVFKTRFVDEVKHAGTEKAFEKSRLVVQGYGDSGKDKILTQAPTIQRASQRILLSLAPSLYAQDMKLYLRDISQAYTQSQTQLTRDIYLKPPTELALQSKFLRLIQPLYGLAESGTHWYNTYHKDRKSVV